MVSVPARHDVLGAAVRGFCQAMPDAARIEPDLSTLDVHVIDCYDGGTFLLEVVVEASAGSATLTFYARIDSGEYLEDFEFIGMAMREPHDS